MDWRPERAGETAPGDCAFEAEQAPARVHAASVLVAALDELAVAGYEANEL
jgi:hypothetical protein